jgi:hypothetical protein
MGTPARACQAGAVPVTYMLAGRLLTVRCEGTYSVDELRNPWIALAERSDLQLPIACVLDMRASDSVLTRSMGDLRAIADSFLMRAEVTGKRIAIVTSGGARYGLMRMAATWAELAGVEAKVFRDLDEAQAWAVSQLHSSEQP